MYERLTDETWNRSPICRCGDELYDLRLTQRPSKETGEGSSHGDLSVLQANRYRQPVPIVRVLVVSSSFAIAGFAMAGCGNTANTTRSSEPITSPAATDLSAAPTSSVTTTSAAAAETSVTPPATAQELNPAGGNNPEDYLMPLVVCMSLQEAQDEVQDHGVFFSRSEDATGQGRNQLIDSNWQVVAQSPAPGTPFGEGDAVLQVVKYGEQPNPC